MNVFKQNPWTTVFGLMIAICQALALVPQLKEYQYIFNGGVIMFTALLGIFAADNKKIQNGG